MTRAAKIALLEDDRDQLEHIASILRRRQHQVETFDTAAALRRKLQTDTFDLLVTDWNLPDTSGVEVTRWLRTRYGDQIPVMIVTVKSEAEDVIEALGAGADDYISKPIHEGVLIARLDALLRRAYAKDESQRVFTFGDYEFDAAQERATYRGEEVTLTSKEFNLALTLFTNLSRALSRSFLLETVWGRNPSLPTRTLDAHVSKVRMKLGLSPANGYLLMPIYSYGYRLEAVEQRAA